MNGATQIINFAAGYLAPELRARRIRSFADLLQMLMGLLDLLRQASAGALLVLMSDVAARFECLQNCLAGNLWLAALALLPPDLTPGLVEPYVATLYGLRNPAGTRCVLPAPQSDTGRAGRSVESIRSDGSIAAAGTALSDTA